MPENNEPRELHPITSFKFDDGLKDFSVRPVIDSDDALEVEELDPKGEFVQASVGSLVDALRHPDPMEPPDQSPENPAQTNASAEENGSSSESTAATVLPESQKVAPSTQTSSTEKKSGKNEPPAPVVPPTNEKTQKP